MPPYPKLILEDGTEIVGNSFGYENLFFRNFEIMEMLNK